MVLSGRDFRLRWVVREGQYLRQAASRADRALVADHVAGNRIEPIRLSSRRMSHQAALARTCRDETVTDLAGQEDGDFNAAG